ncbi:hypothetical protein L596_007066 [Steinernema carpocapsae]|uniref:Calponin-homology (CH) domain-containing protein n=1 Tax=Steinernema carpocapsae TaxID=34508 RepID=A0A4U5P839_STECR|nr:hypothetical protein L596_007066 [Steinernema carpocapsae]
MSLSPGFDALERRRLTRTDERDAIQKKTFTKWVNKHLTKAGRNVTDLFVDLQDGLNLIALLEALSSERLRRENGLTRFHRIQNVQESLDFLKKKNDAGDRSHTSRMSHQNIHDDLSFEWNLVHSIKMQARAEDLSTTPDA